MRSWQPCLELRVLLLADCVGTCYAWVSSPHGYPSLEKRLTLKEARCSGLFRPLRNSVIRYLSKLVAASRIIFLISAVSRIFVSTPLGGGKPQQFSIPLGCGKPHLFTTPLGGGKPRQFFYFGEISRNRRDFRTFVAISGRSQISLSQIVAELCRGTSITY